MKVENTILDGVLLLDNFVSEDKRGVFVKTFNAQKFQEAGLSIDFKESYYSESYKGVIRGMHFQLPPHAHSKLVYVTKGTILDVVVDLRRASATYKQYVAITLEANKNSVYIPAGCAHGFLTLSETATVVYNVTSVYEPTADAGIKWDSIGFEWPIEMPIVSERDSSFVDICDFKSMF